MQSMLCDSLLVQIATHEQRQSLTQFFGDLESSTHRVKASTLICYSPVACVALTCGFLSRCVVMAEPRVLILGHSFIRRLREFVRLPTNALREDFDITTPMNLRWHGIGGRTVAKVIRYDLEIVRQFSPDIVILQLGTNDISARSIRSALTVGSQLEDLTKLLHEQFGVTVVCVCQTIRRENAHLNVRIRTLTDYLRVVLHPLSFAFYWRHRGFWKTTQSFLLHDGVHLNQRGQFKLYRSLRGALIQSLKVFNDVQG